MKPLCVHTFFLCPKHSELLGGVRALRCGIRSLLRLSRAREKSMPKVSPVCLPGHVPDEGVLVRAPLLASYTLLRVQISLLTGSRCTYSRLDRSYVRAFFRKPIFLLLILCCIYLAL
jgi:hypothetical protein